MEKIEEKIQNEKKIILVQRVIMLIICFMYFYMGSMGYFNNSTITLMLLFVLSVIMGDKTESNKIDPRVYHFLLEAAAMSLLVILIIFIADLSWLYLGGWLLSLFLGLVARILKYPRNISITENDF